MGAPTTYTQETADEIIRRLSAGEPLAEICRSEGMPAPRTVSGWRKAHKDFDERFLEARDEGYDTIAADSLAIIDAEPETMATEHGVRIDPASVARQKARAEHRLKLLAKWDPRRYGDRLALDHGVQDSLADKLRAARERAGKR